MTEQDDKIWINKLQNGVSVYFYDDFEEIVIMIDPSNDNKATVKRPGKEPYLLERSAKLVYDAIQGGELVDEEFFKAF